MKDIKTKTSSKAPKTLDLVSRMPRSFKQKSLLDGKLKELTGEAQRADDAPVGSAVDSSIYGTGRAITGTARSVKNTTTTGIKGVRKIRRIMKDSKSASQTGTNNANTYQAGKRRAIQSAKKARQASQQAKGAIKTTKKTIKTAEKTSRQAVKATQKTIRTASKSIKTTAQAAKTAAKTAQTTARAAQTIARALAKAAQMAIKVAITVVKAIAKAVAYLVKLAIAAIQAFIAWLAAGGWVVLLIVLVVAVIVLIIGSAFGIFFSNDADNGKLTEAIVETQTEFSQKIQDEIDRLASSGSYDQVNVYYEGDWDGDSDMVNNWMDVLGVYGVRVTYDDGQDALIITPEKIERLKETFNDMNNVEFRTETETHTEYYYEDGEEKSTTIIILNIYIKITSISYVEGAAFYSFDDDRMNTLEELMSPDYSELFAQILNVEIYGGLSSQDLKGIVSNLPEGTSGKAIVEAAMSKIGTPYSQMDCSQLSGYAYRQVGVSLPRTAAEQARYCYNNGYSVGSGELQPGDLVFWTKTSCKCGRWQEIHHVGVYIGGGRIVDASSSRGIVVLRNLWSGGNWQIILYARPHV